MQSLTSHSGPGIEAGELRSAPSGPDARGRVAGKRALALGVRVRGVREERAIKYGSSSISAVLLLYLSRESYF